MTKSIRFDAARPWEDKFADVGQRREINCRNRFPRAISGFHGDYSSTIFAAAQVRFVILVQRHVPKDYAARPVACRVNDQTNLLIEEIPSLPSPAGAFRQPDRKIGK